MEITTVKPFLDYYERLRGRTLRVIKCIPPEKIDWTYREGKFTLGDIIRHLAAIERFMFAEIVQLKPSLYPGHGKELGDGYDAAVDFMNGKHDETMEIFGGLTDEELRKKCITPHGAPLTIWRRLPASKGNE